MKLIDKDAVVAEIERILNEVKESTCESDTGTFYAMKHLRSFLDTLEVREIDLEEEFNNFLESVEGVPRMWHSDEQIVWAKSIAKHFFELGLNTRKEN